MVDYSKLYQSMKGSAPIGCVEILSLMNISATDYINKLSLFYPWSKSELYKYGEYLNWSFISENESIEWNEELIQSFDSYLFFSRDNGVYPEVCGLSANKAIPFTKQLIWKYKDKWDWTALTDNPSISWTEKLLDEFKDYWSWEVYEFAGNIGLSRNENLPWSIDLIEKFKDKWFWSELSSNPALPWSMKLLELYMDRWDWSGHYGYSGLSVNPSPIVRKLLLTHYSDQIEWQFFCKPLSLPITSQKQTSIEQLTICDIYSIVQDKKTFLEELKKLSFFEYFNDNRNLDWKILFASNVLLFKDMNKQDKCNMLYGYAETLSDKLANKLGFDMREESFYKYVKTIKDVGIIDTRLEDFVAEKVRTLSDAFYKDVQELDVLYIEKNINTLEPLRFCKNLKFIVFDGYWISKYNFRDFSPLKHMPSIYVWHNSGDTRIEKSFLDYTNIKSFSNIRYSESVNDPWADFCNEIIKFSNE